jgi:hypothetical protein
MEPKLGVYMRMTEGELTELRLTVEDKYVLWLYR